MSHWQGHRHPRLDHHRSVGEQWNRFFIAAAVFEGVQGRAVGIEILLKAIGVVIETEIGELVGVEFLQTFGD